MSEHTQDIKKEVKAYISVFLALMILTIITVAISYVHLAVPLAITVALVVAVTKGSLVASFFMHLSHEKKIIYASLLLTIAFFVMLLSIPAFGLMDHIGKPFHLEGVKAPATAAPEH